MLRPAEPCCPALFALPSLVYRIQNNKRRFGSHLYLISHFQTDGQLDKVATDWTGVCWGSWAWLYSSRPCPRWRRGSRWQWRPRRPAPPQPPTESIKPHPKGIHNNNNVDFALLGTLPFGRRWRWRSRRPAPPQPTSDSINPHPKGIHNNNNVDFALLGTLPWVQRSDSLQRSSPPQCRLPPWRWIIINIIYIKNLGKKGTRWSRHGPWA